MSQKTVGYSIIVTGGELLVGKYADVHTQFITKTLHPLGFRCLSSTIVWDKPDELRRALRNATVLAPITIVTGGLGPTRDDITREVISEFSGIGLTENREVITHLEHRFSVKPGNLRDNIRRQGLTPINGTYLPNPNGTAVGLVFEMGHQTIIALPGPPGELKPMITERLVPLIAERYGAKLPDSMLQMRFVGIGESSIDKTIRDHLVLPEELEVSSLFEEGRVDLTFSLPGSGPETMNQLRVLERRLQAQIGQYMYSDDGSTLEEQVLKLLAGRNLTIGVAEVGSGGAVAAGLSAFANSTGVLKGGISADSDTGLFTIIRPRGQETVAIMEPARFVLNRVCEMFDSKWCLWVSEPELRQGGSRSVRILLGSSEGILSEKVQRLRGRGKASQGWLVTAALDLIRRELTAQ